MKKWTYISAIFVLLGGCRGQISEKPPIHGVRNMFFQPKYTAQAADPFFADGRAQREPVAGTVARDALLGNPEIATGKKADGQYVWLNPVPVTKELLERGQQRFDIYCAVCHDRSGAGKGIVLQRSIGFPPPPNYTEDRIMKMPDGEIFNDITNGVRTMPAYRYQIPVSDRWAIVAYVRALQRSQHTRIDDLPIEQRNGLQ